jgi:hypothetical protein
MDPRWQSDIRSPALDESLTISGLAYLCEARARDRRWAYLEVADRLQAVYAVRARETIS